MTTTRRSALLCLLVLLCLPGSAAALPGDAPFAPLSPADGATLPVDPDGIPVSYTCPVYRIADPGFPLFGGPKDYGVTLSTSPALGADGRLADGTLNTGSADPAVGPDGCSSALGAGGSPPRVQETPGVYYWQVWRLCTGCTGSYEVGPVRKLTLRSEVAPTLRAPARAYAGYPFFVTARLAGTPDGTTAMDRAAVRVSLALGGHRDRAGRQGRGRGQASARRSAGPCQADARRSTPHQRAPPRVGATRAQLEHPRC